MELSALAAEGGAMAGICFAHSSRLDRRKGSLIVAVSLARKDFFLGLSGTIISTGWLHSAQSLSVLPPRRRSRVTQASHRTE